jgi:hypothetical protein
MVFARRHWIPPAALLYAHLAHGFSWVLLLWAAWSGTVHGYVGFAWIHTVVLGWVTMAALAILLHALPNFVDVEYRGQTVSRWALVAYGAGVALLIYGFVGSPRVLAPAGDLLLASIVVYVAMSLWTLSAAFRGERVQRAVARAFSGTLLFLLATAVIGYGLAGMLGGRGVTWAASLPAAHAALGTLGWLSLLIFGVSMRTLRPITGQATRMRWMHIVVGTCALAGVPLLAAGLASHRIALAWIGAALFALAALGYTLDVADILRRATNPHRPPQIFVACSLAWFWVALALGGFTLSGRPWAAPYMFALLMGWIGQMVLAHLHHIGIRLVATVYRGEDDETRPQQLLEARLTWFTVAAFQIAVALAVAGLMHESLGQIARASIFGIGGWIAMTANVLTARARAKAPQKTISLLQ